MQTPQILELSGIGRKDILTKYGIECKIDLPGVGENLRKLRLTKGVAAFFFEQILCRYGAVVEVVTDNGPEFKEAFQRLMKRYKLPQIKISSYNSKANGVVERGHFIIRESILKACEGHVEKWPDYVHHAFFTDRITISQSTGFSPYYLLYGVEPILPFDLAEMTLLVDGFHAGRTTTELLALRIRQLRKKPEDIAKAAALLKKTRFRSAHGGASSQVFNNTGTMMTAGDGKIEDVLS